MALLQSGTRIYGNTTIDTFLTVGANANILSTTASTSNTTGALTVSGGVGVRGSVYADAVFDGGVEILVLSQAAFNQANSAAQFANTDNTVIVATTSSSNGTFVPVVRVAANGRVLSITNTAIFGVQANTGVLVNSIENSVMLGSGAGNDRGGARPGGIIAIGTNALRTLSSANAIGIGAGAASAYAGAYSISIGNLSGAKNVISPTQANTIAIGTQAGGGATAQASNAIAIGLNAGYTNQGANSIAIGVNAGYSLQSANSIAINANNGTELNPTNYGLFIDPIRPDSSQTNILYYNSTTKEISYGSSGTSDPTLIAATTSSSNGTFIPVVQVAANGRILSITNTAILSSTADATQNLAIAYANSTVNTLIGVDATQNLAIAAAFTQANLTVGVDESQNVTLTYIQNVDFTQNVSIAAAYAQANVTVGVDATQNASITVIQGVDNTQNASIVVIQNVDLTQNNQIQAAFDQANVTVGVDATQNLAIAYANSTVNTVQLLAQAAFNQANVTIGVDDTQNASITIIQGVDNTQNDSIVIIQGVDTTQNLSIESAFNQANSAAQFANTDVTNISTTAGTFGNSTFIPVITVQSNGRVSSIVNTSILPITETVFTITDAAGFEINPANGTIQYVQITTNRTPKGTSFASGQSLTLLINAGASNTITWTDGTWGITKFGACGVSWIGNTAPTLSTVGNTVIELWKLGPRVYGALVGSVG